MREKKNHIWMAINRAFDYMVQWESERLDSSLRRQKSKEVRKETCWIY